MSNLIRSLQLFQGVNEQGSFSAFARQKNLSHTTVARAIDDLEAHFGVRLFHRSTRSLTLTREGELLLDHAATILDQLEQAEAELTGAKAVKGLVRLGVTTALGLHYAEKLPALKDRHRGLSVELLIADWRDVSTDSAFDLWLTVGEQPLAAQTPLGNLPLILVAAPSFLEKRGEPKSVEELLAQDCLSYGYEARPSTWVIDGHEVRPSGFLRANSSEAVHRAVRGGLGIALLPSIQVEGDLASGTLFQLLTDTDIDPVFVSVGHNPGFRHIPLRVQTVRDFLVEHFPGHPSA